MPPTDGIPRRRFLGTATIAVLAGCLGESDDATTRDDPRRTTDAQATEPAADDPVTSATNSHAATESTARGATDATPATDEDATTDGRIVEDAPTDRRATDRDATASSTGGTPGDAPRATPTASDAQRATPTANDALTETPPVETDRARVGFTGDVMLGRSVDEYRDSRPPESVWGDMAGRIEALDALCINLECCISDRGERWPDRTYYFRADPDWAIPALREVGVGWASLANNHLLDFGPTALLDTIEHLSDAAIATSGAGANREAAREPASLSTGGVDLGFVSFTDNSPEYAAQPDRPGTAYIEMDTENAETREIVRDAIAEAREADPDVLVASLHWGPNWVVRPDDQYVEFAYWLAEEGVDLIHGHSAHVFQGVEVYEDTLILHDTGDLVDDYVVKEDLHNDRSFLFEVTFEGGIEQLRLVPVEIDVGVYRASEEAAAWARERMRELSSEFGTTFERDGAALVLDLDGIE